MDPSPRSSASRSGTPPEAETSSRYFRVNNAAGKNSASSGAITAGVTSMPATCKLIVLLQISDRVRFAAGFATTPSRSQNALLDRRKQIFLRSIGQGLK
jgi:hypothetical protein